MGNILNYFKEVRLELTKITWPKRDEIVRLTLVVLIFSTIVALYVGALDLIYTKLLGSIISR